MVFDVFHGDVWTEAWRERHSGFVCQHNDDNLTDAWNKCKPDDEWRPSHWETSSWSSSHWETSGWNDTDECSNDRKEHMQSSHSFFETKSMLSCMILKIFDLLSFFYKLFQCSIIYFFCCLWTLWFI